MTFQGRLLQLLLATLGRLPLRANHLLGAAIGRLLVLLAPRSRAVTRINLKLSLPERDPADRRQLARQSFVQAGKAMTELGYFWSQSSQRILGQIRHIHGLELFDQAINDGNGILLAAPHLGAWELLCMYLSSRGECAILYREPRDAGVAAVITGGRERLGADLIAANAQGVRELFRAAKQGKIIGILPDQQPKRGNGEFAQFFGQTALTMVLYSRLAAKTDCALIVGWAERLPAGRGFDLHFAEGDRAIRDRDLAVSTAALNRSIEQQIRHCPEQYQWSYKRFGIQPDGVSPYVGAP